jgi:hypothetical protein
MSQVPSEQESRGPREPPQERPLPLFVMGMVAGVIALAVGLWFVLPDGPLTIVLLAVLVLGSVFFGAYKILSLPQLNRPPARRTEPPSERSDG